MKKKIVHLNLMYEYRLPLTEVPTEADSEWVDWLTPFIGRDPKGVHDLIQSRFTAISPELLQLSSLVMNYSPFAIIIFEGTPLIWLEDTKKRERDFIYLPPESDYREVKAALSPYRLDSHELLVEFFTLFGGMGDRWPFEAVEFSGRRHRSKTIIVPATEIFENQLEYRSEDEIQKRLPQIAPWMDGIQLLYGGDGLCWHIGLDGRVCEQEFCYSTEPPGQFDSLSTMLKAFPSLNPEKPLFHKAYYGFSASCTS